MLKRGSREKCAAYFIVDEWLAAMNIYASQAKFRAKFC